MKKFEFSSKSGEKDPIFSGDIFYRVYNNAEFLHHSENIETILSKGYELRKSLKDVAPGQLITVAGMLLERNTPLLVKKTGPNVHVENFEFTANRLSGLVAAYAFENRLKFPALESTEALALGLKWDNDDEKKCRLFLASVSGTEHFYSQFQFWPLVCGLKKLQQNKITIEPIVKMAKIKNQEGVRMATSFMRNLSTVRELWSHFPDSTKVELKAQLESLPPVLKKVFFQPY